MKISITVAVFVLLLAACQVPGVKEVEEKIEGVSGQVSLLRTAGEDIEERLEGLEDQLDGLRFPDTGDIEMPDMSLLLQDIQAGIDSVKTEFQAQADLDRAEIDSLRAVITDLEEEIGSLSSRITTLENRSSGSSSGSSSSGRGSTTGGTSGRGGTTGGTSGGR